MWTGTHGLFHWVIELKISFRRIVKNFIRAVLVEIKSWRAQWIWFRTKCFFNVCLTVMMYSEGVEMVACAVAQCEGRASFLMLPPHACDQIFMLCCLVSVVPNYDPQPEQPDHCAIGSYTTYFTDVWISLILTWAEYNLMCICVYT